MKKLILAVGIVFILFSCDNGGMSDGEEGPYSLIGTWEAAGDYYSPAMGENRNYKATLVFKNETEFSSVFSWRDVGTSEWKSENEYRGTYTYDDKNISYVGKFYSGSGGESREYPANSPYKFTDKNTLSTRGPIMSSDIANPVFKRKN